MSATSAFTATTRDAGVLARRGVGLAIRRRKGARAVGCRGDVRDSARCPRFRTAPYAGRQPIRAIPSRIVTMSQPASSERSTTAFIKSGEQPIQVGSGCTSCV
jgi:hypothetical protein